MRRMRKEKLMWRIVKVTGIFAFLILCSLQDIKEQKLSVKMLLLSGALFMISSHLFDQISYGQRVAGMLPGMLAFVLAFMSEEQIRYPLKD